MRRPIEDGLSLLVGAGIGMGLMYLLDPEAGPQRRQRVAKATGEMMGQGQSMLGSAWHSVSETAAAAGNTIADRAHSFADHLDPGEARAAGKRLHKRGVKMFNRASDTVSDTSEGVMSRAGHLRDAFMDRIHFARKNARGAADRTAAFMGYERPHSSSRIAGQTACALGSLALGAGLWYLFDPRLGAGRRSWLINKGRRVLRETGEFLRVSGRYVADKMHGAVAEGRTHLMNPPVPDEKLQEHIRAKLGHWVNHAGAIDVIVSGGHVTLRGLIPADEIQKVCSGVTGLRGVVDVDNQLMAGDPSQASTLGANRSIPTAM
jgi:hypothetical protein